MGFLSKIFKPVSKVLDKIIPNEAKPFLPYAAAFAPMFAPGIMGSSMLSRGLMSGGLNLGSQLAQEGSEGDFNPLSVLMAGGIGALSAPGTSSTTGPAGPPGSELITTPGTPSAGEYLSGLSDTGSFGDKGLEFLAKGADKLSALNAAGVADPFSSAGLKASVLPFAQATGDLAYADAQRALRDFEDSQGGGSGYAEGDQNRGLAVRRAMERGGHEEQTIQDMLESLGYEDPDPQALAYGGRVGLREGGLSMMGQMGLLGNNQSRPMNLGMYNNNTLGFGGMGGGNNSPIFPRLDELQSGVSQAESSLESINGRLGAPNGGSLSTLQAQRPGLQMNMSRVPEGLDAMRTVPAANGGIMSNQRMNFAGGGMDYMPTEPRMMGNPAVMEMIEAGDDMRENRIMNPDVEDVADYSIELKEETKEPDFGGIKEAIKNVDIKEKEEKLDDMGDLMAYEPGVPTTGDLYDLNNPDYEGINKKVIIEFIEEGIPLGYTSPEEYFDDFYGIGSLKKDKPKKIMTAKNGGMMSVLPEGMEMDYRGGGFIPMGSKEKADDVPARVSKNEFVMTADAVKAAGGGSVNEGARKMYNLMNNLEARA